MLSSLSDRTKTFIVYSAVFVVAVCNILFELNWTMATGPQTRPAAAVVGPALAPIAVETAPAQADGKQTNDNAAPAATKAPVARIANEAAQPQCDVNACAAAYRSFRASDCTYLPGGGERRLCTKGTPPQ